MDSMQLKQAKLWVCFRMANQMKNSPLFSEENKIGGYVPTNLNMLSPTYPNASLVNEGSCPELYTDPEIDRNDWTRMQNRRDLWHKVQTESQQQVLTLIRSALELAIHLMLLSLVDMV